MIALCDVCERRLSDRGRRVHGICQECRRDGAAFARRWAFDMHTGGLSRGAIAEILGSTVNSVSARLSEMRRGLTP